MTIFAVQMLWIPLWAAGVINGLPVQTATEENLVAHVD